jgi:hypothetical protein
MPTLPSAERRCRCCAGAGGRPIVSGAGACVSSVARMVQLVRNAILWCREPCGSRLINVVIFYSDLISLILFTFTCTCTFTLTFSRHQCCHATAGACLACPHCYRVPDGTRQSRPGGPPLSQGQRPSSQDCGSRANFPCVACTRQARHLRLRRLLAARKSLLGCRLRCT